MEANRADAGLIDRPPAFFRRVAASVRDAAAANWGVGPARVGESRELYARLERHVRTGEALTQQDPAVVRTFLAHVGRALSIEAPGTTKDGSELSLG